MAFGIDDAIAGVSKLLDDGINKIWPDPQAKASAEATIMQATADAAIKQLQAQMSVMLAEAQSSDKWTSRARPSFLYVFYLMIIVSIPMGIVSAINPATAVNIAHGMQSWLASIPDQLYQAFWICFLGYVGGRTYEKVKGVSK